ncbi:MAG: hypothetical protein M3Q31_12215 [Actinomycetota bacterium]|nr:hypothetical protein [Actinomycetota bacterium]
MDKVLDELDNQEVHLRRLARRIDGLQPAEGGVELQVGRILQLRLEQLHATRADDPPPGWPDAASTMVARVGAQREAIELVARRVEELGGAISTADISRSLAQGRERMPFALEGRFHEGPLVVTPSALERDFYELLFNPQQEALLRIDNAIDGLEGTIQRPRAPD